MDLLTTTTKKNPLLEIEFNILFSVHFIYFFKYRHPLVLKHCCAVFFDFSSAFNTITPALGEGCHPD